MAIATPRPDQPRTNPTGPPPPRPRHSDRHRLLWRHRKLHDVRRVSEQQYREQQHRPFLWTHASTPSAKGSKSPRSAPRCCDMAYRRGGGEVNELWASELHQVRRAIDRREDPLPLTLGDHVPLHHVAHDARDQRVAAWLRREPALPFELVERRVEPLPAEARAAAKRLTRHPPADDRGDRERALPRRMAARAARPSRRPPGGSLRAAHPAQPGPVGGRP